MARNYRILSLVGANEGFGPANPAIMGKLISASGNREQISLGKVKSLAGLLLAIEAETNKIETKEECVLQARSRF